jgi:hypothetical protein
LLLQKKSMKQLFLALSLLKQRRGAYSKAARLLVCLLASRKRQTLSKLRYFIGMQAH